MDNDLRKNIIEPSFFWKNIIRAVEAEPHEAASIPGASGFQHSTLAVGVDDSRRRLIVISADVNAYSAAMAQSDIQRNMQSVQVIMARPIAANLPDLADTVSTFFNRRSINLNELTKFLSGKKEVLNEIIGPAVERITNPFRAASLNPTASFLQIIQQLSKIRVETIEEKSEDPAAEHTKQYIFHLEKLMSTDPTEDDRKLGICAVPLYGFSPDEIEIIQGGTDIELIKDLLRRQHLFQYFFPAPDQLALGLVDRGTTQLSQVVDRLSQAPSLGHPFGPLEITPSLTSITKVIDVLQERKLIVEGEIGLEVTPEGQSFRTAVRFKPREGFLSKLINRFSFNFNIDLKDLFRGSGNP